MEGVLAQLEFVIRGPLAGLAVATGVVLFIGSVYLILAAIFGPRMGYLVLAVAFFGWMMFLSVLWVFGLYSQGPDTPTNLGPRGTNPHWQPIAVGVDLASERFPVAAQYPGPPWKVPRGGALPSVDPAEQSIKEFLAEMANEELGVEEGEEGALVAEDFEVDDLMFTVAEDGETNLMAARAFFKEGGPEVLVFGFHDRGNVPVYSWSFLGISIVAFAAHVPFLDRAEQRRKAVLTGGGQPPWYGPA